jgi:hypothetical protein
MQRHRRHPQLPRPWPRAADAVGCSPRPLLLLLAPSAPNRRQPSRRDVDAWPSTLSNPGRILTDHLLS